MNHHPWSLLQKHQHVANSILPEKTVAQKNEMQVKHELTYAKEDVIKLFPTRFNFHQKEKEQEN